MVDKETCIKSINEFVKFKSLDGAATLLNYLCEVKQISNKEEAINTILSTPMLLTSMIPNILEGLEKHFNLVRLSDRYGNIILVY